jgi:hypothetical protein
MTKATIVSEARRHMHIALVKRAIGRLCEYYVFWDGFGSLAAKTRGLVEHDRTLNCEHRSNKERPRW